MNYQPAYEYNQKQQGNQQLPQQMHVNGPHYAPQQPQSYPYTQHGGAGSDMSNAWSAAGSMMQPGLGHRLGINQPYTNSPYSQSAPTPDAVTPQRREQPQPLPPPRPQDSHHSLSPQGSDITQNPQNFSNPQQQTNMAAPPPHQSQPQAQPGMQAQNVPQKPILQPPLSPSSAKREKERVALLLEINRELLQEVVNLQAQGRAGIPGVGPSQSAQQTKEDEKDNDQKQSTSKEFIECMRRLQSNLAYLAAVADRVYKPAKDVPTSPALMEAPPNSPALEVLYLKLRDMFPNAKSQGTGTHNQGQRAAAGAQMTQQSAVTSTA